MTVNYDNIVNETPEMYYIAFYEGFKEPNYYTGDFTILKTTANPPNTWGWFENTVINFYGIGLYQEIENIKQDLPNKHVTLDDYNTTLFDDLELATDVLENWKIIYTHITEIISKREVTY